MVPHPEDMGQKYADKSNHKAPHRGLCIIGNRYALEKVFRFVEHGGE